MKSGKIIALVKGVWEFCSYVFVPQPGLKITTVYDPRRKVVAKYNEVKTFIETNHRNPSKHDPEERFKYYNWLKHNRQLMNAGEMKPERVELFEKLLALCEENKHVNHYK